MERFAGFAFWKRKVLIPASMLILLSGAALAAAPQGAQEAAMKQLTSNIHWLGHDSFRIDGEGIGALSDAARFQEKAPVPVVVLPIEK